jgi:fatty-acyl-CoA synthase
MSSKVEVADGLSIARGIPLSEESGIGSLTLGRYVREIAGRFGPREAAMIEIDGQTERWTYDDLLAKSLEVAKALIACGTGKGTHVDIIVTNRLEFLSCTFGAALAGCVANPISTFYTQPEMEEVLKLSGCSVVLLERKVLKKDFAEMLIGLEPAIATTAPGELASTRFPFLRHLAMIDTDEAEGGIEGWSSFLARGKHVADDLIEATTEAVSPADPAVLMFSSGSTGRAKGILNGNRGVCLQLWRWAQWYNIQPEAPPRTWSANGFFWSGNFCQALGGTLSSGGTLLLQRWFDAEEALALMEKEKATMPLAWPHQWALLAAAPNYESVDLSPMRYVDKTMLIAKHPTITTDWREPAQAYGNTETFTLITVFASGTSPELAVPLTYGHPTPGSTIKIVDPLTGETVPIGERGEIAVKGPTLMLGYVGIPLDQTLDEDGFLRTSDGGYIDSIGRLFWEGRLNDIIKTGGANVSPVEIDAVIREHPKVKLTQTVGVPDHLLGEMVVGCIVPRDGATVSEDDIKAFAREKLSSYKVPRRVLFFEEHELETTGSSKIKTAELRKLAADRLAAEAA